MSLERLIGRPEWELVKSRALLVMGISENFKSKISTLCGLLSDRHFYFGNAYENGAIKYFRHFMLIFSFYSLVGYGIILLPKVIVIKYFIILSCFYINS